MASNSRNKTTVIVDSIEPLSDIGVLFSPVLPEYVLFTVPEILSVLPNIRSDVHLRKF